MGIIFLILIFFIGIFSYLDPVGRLKSALHLFQLEEYNIEKYNKWFENNGGSFGFSKVINEDKTPLVMTDRAKRLFSTYRTLTLSIIIIIGLLSLISENIIYKTFTLVLSIIIYMASPKILNFAAKINAPNEARINQGFYNSAQEKVKSMKDLKVVGITGSYGKTSTKVITSTILKEKYNVQDTPASYNTPMGLSKVINNDLDDSKDIFIAEMGAYTIGEIKECADLVSPDIGILTSIGPAHLESFGSIENTIKTKYELIEALPEDGVAIFNYDDPNLKGVADKTTLKKIYYGIDDISKLDIYATDINVNSHGSDFKLVIKDLGEIKCQTRLLGRHNIKNILAGAAASYILGLSLEEISDGISKIQSIAHRLDLIDSGNGVIVIDDGFNSNPSGAKAALEVLDEFKTGKKFIVTPGMIELGDIEYDENKKFGKEISKVCDFVFLVGKNRTKPIYEGLIEEGYSEDRIYSVDSLNEAIDIYGKLLTPGDVILFENDLPDSYSEV